MISFAKTSFDYNNVVVTDFLGHLDVESICNEVNLCFYAKTMAC